MIVMERITAKAIELSEHATANIWLIKNTEAGNCGLHVTNSGHFVDESSLKSVRYVKNRRLLNEMNI